MIPVLSKLDEAVTDYLNLYGKVPAQELSGRIAIATGLSEEDSAHALGVILLNIEEAKGRIQEGYLKPEFSREACRRAFAASTSGISPDAAFKLFDHALALVTR